MLYSGQLLLLLSLITSKTAFAETHESPYYPYISYSDFHAVTSAERLLIDSQELYSRMAVVKDEYRGMNQVRWNYHFIDLSELEKAMDEVEQKIFKLQADIHSITYAEHDGLPTNYELLALLEEIKIFAKLKIELDNMIQQREALYEITTTEVQENLQLKLKLRELSSAIPLARKKLEWRARIIKNKIDRYSSYAHLNRNVLISTELAKASYNLHVIMEMALEAQKQIPPRSFLSRFFQPPPAVEFVPALSQQLLNLFYLEFESNDPKLPILSSKNRIKEFEDQLIRIRGQKYITQEMKFGPQNGYQEAAYYFARLRDISVDERIYQITERDSLTDYQNFILGYDPDVLTSESCAKYFTK